MRKGIQTERGEIEIDTERVREIKMKGHSSTERPKMTEFQTHLITKVNVRY